MQPRIKLAKGHAAMKARLQKPNKHAAVAKTTPKTMQWVTGSDWLRPSDDCMNWYIMTSSESIGE